MEPQLHHGNVSLDLAARALATPDGDALVAPDGPALSYAALESRVQAAARTLHAHGVRTGDVVALAILDQVLLAAAFLAVLRLGGTVVSIPARATPHQRDDIVARTRPAALATDRPGTLDCGVREIDLTAEAPAVEAPTCDSPDAPAVLIMGSGSTGRPKIIPLTHANLRGRIVSQCGSFGIRPGDRICSLSELDYFGPKLRVLEAAAHGAAVVLPPATFPSLPAEIARMGVTILHATVMHIELLLRALPASSTLALGGLRALVITSSTVSDDLRRRIRERLTGALYVRYGTNESGQLTTAGPPEVFDIPGTVGRVEAAVDLELVGGRGQPVGPGERGFARVRSPGQTAGYAGDDEATARAFQGGWCMPGDVLQREGEHLVFLGRADDMMIVNGVNVYPAEIEGVLTSHPDVVEAAAFPLPHRVHQHVPVCAVTLRDGATATADELSAYARERLGARSPSRVMVMPEIPRKEQGKLDRQRLVQHFAAAVGARARA